MLNIWDKLANRGSGLSVLDWVAIDKDAAKDLNDGLRDLRRQRPKKTRRHLENLNGTGMDADPPNKINVVDNVSKSSDSSYYDSDGSGDSNEANDSEDLNFDDSQSVYRYPYNLTQIKWSSPLKTQVTINGKFVVVACFDDGASISVISRSLCDSLGFVTNSDTLQLVDFDNNSSGQRAKIVKEVPIKIQPGQDIRPDHTVCVCRIM